MKELNNHYAQVQLGTPTFKVASHEEQVTDWGANVVMAPYAWKKNRGKGIKIAVLDTGIDKDHPDLIQNLKGGINFTSGDRNDYQDRQGHGSHVAGVIAGSDNDIGVVGIAPQAEIYAVKVLGDNGSGSLQWIAQGIEWAVENDMDLISMSLGTTQEPPIAFQEYFQYAIDHGIPVIAASGNENQHVGWPGAYPETISVAAMDRDYERAVFSNYGPETDIIAPGVDIYSTWTNGEYARISGTSMATPIVTGALALLMKEARDNETNLDVKDYKSILYKSSVDLGDDGKDNIYGTGLINLARLLK